MFGKLDPLAVGYASGILYGVGLLALGVVANLGMYRRAADLLSQMHMFFSLSFLGLVGGMIEGGVLGFISGLVFATVYNAFAR